MSRLAELFNKNKMTLIVSLPFNSVEMAKAAEEAGADGLKVHVNAYHPASNKTFPAWQEEKENLKKILQSVKIPIGIVPASSPDLPLAEMEEIMDSGFAFFDIYAHHCPPSFLKLKTGKMLAVNPDYTLDQIKSLATLDFDVLETSVLPHSSYGNPLTVKDVATYKLIASSIPKPIIVSTQLKLKPEEVSILYEAGARGIMLGIVVTGDTIEGISKYTRLFKTSMPANERGFLVEIS